MSSACELIGLLVGRAAADTGSIIQTTLFWLTTRKSARARCLRGSFVSGDVVATSAAPFVNYDGRVNALMRASTRALIQHRMLFIRTCLWRHMCASDCVFLDQTSSQNGRACTDTQCCTITLAVTRSTSNSNLTIDQSGKRARRRRSNSRV